MACDGTNSRDHLLSLFPDNTTNEISPEDIRTFITALYDLDMVRTDLVQDNLSNASICSNVLSAGMGKTLNETKEDKLGTPAQSDYILTSDTSGNRDWVPSITWLRDLKDTSINGVANGESLVYDSNTGNWINQAVASIAEQGGIAWNDVANYKVGDIVTDSVGVYFALLDNSGAGAQPSSNPGTWQPISNTVSVLSDLDDVNTLGGVSDGDYLKYNSTSSEFVNSNFKDDVGLANQSGLITSNNGIKTISLAGGVTEISLDANIGDLKDVDTSAAPTDGQVLTFASGSNKWKAKDVSSAFTETGGKEWAPGSYSKGDVVSYSTDVYTALTSTTVSPGGTSTDWQKVLSSESLGSLYDPSYTYKSGDIVSYNGFLYVSVATQMNNQPDSGTDWVRSAAEIAGKVWDNLTQYANGDVVTVGTALYIAMNNPALGADPTSNPLTWQLVDFAMNETGGKLWKSALSYEAGDLVSYGGITYLATGSSVGSQPDTNPGQWKLSSSGEVGGREWDTLKSYLIGDIVVENGLMYFCILDAPVLTPPPSTPGFWQNVAVSDIGGREWDPDTTYMSGDIVSVGSDIFIAKVDNLNGGNNPSNSPDLLPGVWYNSTRSGERGGLLWNPVVGYFLGDIVSVNGEIYTCIVATSTGFDPSVPGTLDWKVFRTTEFGGISHDNHKTYQRGDIVSVGTEIWIATVNNTQGTSDIKAPEWYNASQPEAGGVAWNANTGYNKGDIVTDETQTANRPDLGYGQKVVYIAIIDVPVSTTATPNVSPAIDVDAGGPSWAVLEIRNQKGISFDPSLGYLAGDIVAAPGKGIGEFDLFVAPLGISPNGAIPTADVPGIWTLVTPNERAGRAWDNSTVYLPGDVVTDGINGTKPTAWMAILPVIGTQPDAGAWIELDFSFNVSTVFDPNRDYDEGDIITALVDTQQQLFVAPAGIPSGSWDPLLWVQVTKDEKGGLQWNGDNTSYNIGDVVSSLPGAGLPFELYVCINPIAALPTNNPPVLDTTNWEPIQNDEIAGRSWISGQKYLVGDIITDPNNNNMIYTCIVDTSGTSAPSISPADWRPSVIPDGINDGDLIRWDDTLSEWIAVKNIKMAFTASANRTVFDTTIIGGTANTADVFVNGALQRANTSPVLLEDYSIIGGVVTLNSPTNDGDWVQINTIG